MSICCVDYLTYQLTALALFVIVITKSGLSVERSRAGKLAKSREGSTGLTEPMTLPARFHSVVALDLVAMERAGLADPKRPWRSGEKGFLSFLNVRTW